MLPFPHRIAFLLFALITSAIGLHGFYRLYRRIQAGRRDTDLRFDQMPRRVWEALVTTLTQSRTFRKRTWVSTFHSLIFYGFVFYLLVNLVDALEGFVTFSVTSSNAAGGAYNLLADVLSAGVLLGVVALVIRRFLLPSRRDFSFNERTLLHKDVKQRYVTRDSIIVSAFILFHVGSRALGSGAKLAVDGRDRFQPFASLLSHLFTTQNAEAWRIFGYWGALGSVLAFLMYFPYSKHIHIFMAPAKYVVTRHVNSGVLPALDLQMDAEEPKLGAAKLEDLAWPRLLDAYACVQCNRCQDVCPATATGKSLSPSALEINKRMELNDLARTLPSFEHGVASPNPLLSFALSPEAAWACTTCGACIDVCPVGDEPMLDIIDIRRQQVMVEGEFPSQLQSAFRGMERAKNPWGINHDKRMDWAAGLNVKTTDQNPEPDVLYWVGCAASYDPQSQKTARAFVQLLDHAGVDFAVLGKRECCTGDSARRAGNEYLYRQLADENVKTLNEIKPKLIVATCPHCLNSVGKEYKQIGGDYKVMHHTEYLESLVASGKLVADSGAGAVAFHDPCYLGRHNKVYDAPRNLLNILTDDVVELPRNKANSFCCGAGGAQFWKEEEEGDERISDNRYREAEQTLSTAAGETKTLAVGCPFCKSMLDSTPGKSPEALLVRDVAELLLEGVQRRSGLSAQTPVMTEATAATLAPPPIPLPIAIAETQTEAAQAKESQSQNPAEASAAAGDSAPAPERKKWAPKSATVQPPAQTLGEATDTQTTPARKAWRPKSAVILPNSLEHLPADPDQSNPLTIEKATELTPTPEQPAAVQSSPARPAHPESTVAELIPAQAVPAVKRKVWSPKSSSSIAGSEPLVEQSALQAEPGPDVPASEPSVARKVWKPKALKTDVN